MFRTKRSKERARARGRIQARTWLSTIQTDVATATTGQPREMKSYKGSPMLSLVFGMNPDGTRQLLWRDFIGGKPCSA